MKKCGNKPENIIKYNSETEQYTNMFAYANDLGEDIPKPLVVV